MKLLQYNVRMLPGLLGRGEKDEERARHIISAIQHYDVICLCEVFDEDIRSIFVNELPHQYVIKKGDVCNLKEDSGLFLASKQPITNEFFVPFDDSADSDFFSNKGVMGCDINGITIMNTHLQADYEAIGEYDHIRLAQIHTIASLQENKPTLIVGDFNIFAEEPLEDPCPTAEYLRMLEVLGVTDLYRSHHQDFGYTYSNNNIYVPSNVESQRLDYMLGFCISDYDIRIRRFMSGNADLSDHYALELELRS